MADEHLPDFDATADELGDSELKKEDTGIKGGNSISASGFRDFLLKWGATIPEGSDDDEPKAKPASPNRTCSRSRTSHAPAACSTPWSTATTTFSSA